MEDQNGTVSREAHERMTRERDELKQQLSQASAALTDLVKRDKVREALKGRVADPDIAAEFFVPHLRDVAPEAVVETLGSDRFVSMMSLMSNPAATPPAAPETPAPPTNPGPVSSFSGPNPGAVGGPAPEPGKLKAGTKEFYDIARGPNGKARIAEMAEAGQVEWRNGDSQTGGVPISNRFG